MKFYSESFWPKWSFVKLVPALLLPATAPDVGLCVVALLDHVQVLARAQDLVGVAVQEGRNLGSRSAFCKKINKKIDFFTRNIAVYAKNGQTW
jgi:hypothetical protein